jgi:protein-tyrosine-phosphatase
LHTEKLEEEKKHFTATITDLEEALQSMKMREAELLREKSEWIVTHQQMTQYIDGLHMEKDELIRVHTLETAELRKKNNILMETVDKLERGMKPVQENLQGDFTGFENLTMESHPWEDFPMTNGIPMQQECRQPIGQVKALEKSSDLPISWNAFYMCLLFGAYIASNSTSIPGRSLPQLSEEYRVESANVLKAVLASSPSHDMAHAHAHGTSTGPTPATISGMEMAQMSVPSTMDQLHNNLVMPTEQQEREQLFSLNANQYNSLTTFEDDGYKPQQPSTLQQALAAMRNTAAQHSRMASSSSDVHSRSLMWDRVPEKVIRDFRRMVQDFATPVKEEGIFHA